MVSKGSKRKANKGTEHKLVKNFSYKIHKKKGNGSLRYQMWEDITGQVVKYSIAYINPNIFAGDNGRVLGYDNSHNYHHKHYMGEITPVTFTHYDEIEVRFGKEFGDIHEQYAKETKN